MTEIQNRFVNKFARYSEHLKDDKKQYNNFVQKMQRDKKFEDMILAMTIQRIKGKSIYEKNKFQWK